MVVIDYSTVPISSLSPDYVLGNETAMREILAAIAKAYSDMDGKYKNFHMQGMGRWLEIVENVLNALQAHGVRYKRVQGQPRLVWTGLGPESVEMVVVRGKRQTDGFDTSERGPASEDLSQLEFGSFSAEGGEPWTSGAFLFHDEEEAGMVSVYICLDGVTRDGWKRVDCRTVFHIGTVPYLKAGGAEGDEPVDIRP